MNFFLYDKVPSEISNIKPFVVFEKDWVLFNSMFVMPDAYSSSYYNLLRLDKSWVNGFMDNDYFLFLLGNYDLFRLDYLWCSLPQNNYFLLLLGCKLPLTMCLSLLPSFLLLKFESLLFFFYLTFSFSLLSSLFSCNPSSFLSSFSLTPLPVIILPIFPTGVTSVVVIAIHGSSASIFDLDSLINVRLVKFDSEDDTN